MAVAYRRLRIMTPSVGTYYGVVDDNYRPHVLASRWLEVRFGRAQAETTSAQYSSSVALFLTWAQRTGRDLPAAARDLHLFAAYLSTTALTTGRSAGWPRSAGRVNRILVAVREFYRFAVAEGELEGKVLGSLFELPDQQDFRGRSGPRVRHRRREMRRVSAPDQASAAEAVALLEVGTNVPRRVRHPAAGGDRASGGTGPRAAPPGRALRAGRGGARIAHTRRHWSPCRVLGEHLHVVRRATRTAPGPRPVDFAVPVPEIVLALYDRYLEERERCGEAPTTTCSSSR